MNQNFLVSFSTTHCCLCPFCLRTGPKTHKPKKHVLRELHQAKIEVVQQICVIHDAAWDNSTIFIYAHTHFTIQREVLDVGLECSYCKPHVSRPHSDRKIGKPVIATNTAMLIAYVILLTMSLAQLRLGCGFLPSKRKSL
jgi:hypothetical protein